MYTYTFEAFTTVCELQIDAQEESSANKLADDIFLHAKRLEEKYIYFKEDSELYKVNHRDINSLHVSDEFIIFEGEKFEGELIFTGMIDELFDFRFGSLPYRSIELVFENHAVESFQNATTTNYPNDYDYTRITEFKKMYDAKNETTTIAKEYPQEFIYGQNTPYYPLFTDENQKRYEEYKSYAKQFKNLTLVGRLAEYKYYDMDDIVLRALEIYEEKFADA